MSRPQLGLEAAKSKTKTHQKKKLNHIQEIIF